MMIMKKCTIALAVAALAGGCSLLGHKSDSGSSSGSSSHAQTSSSAAGGSSSASGASSQGSLASSTIEQLQRTLNDKGFDAGPVDGNWGPQTQSALRNFQQAKGLKATGQPDPQTLSALGVKEGASSATGGSSSGQNGSQGAAGGTSNSQGDQQRQKQ